MKVPSRRPQHTISLNKDDRLLGRGANPRTGVVTPTEESVISDEHHQQRERPKIDVAAQQGSWKASNGAWIHICNEIQSKSLSKIEPVQDGASKHNHNNRRIDFLDPYTPPTPPESASLLSADKQVFSIKRKPVGGERAFIYSKDNQYGNASSSRPDFMKKSFTSNPEVLQVHHADQSNLNKIPQLRQAREAADRLKIGTDGKMKDENVGKESSDYDPDRLTGWVVETGSSRIECHSSATPEEKRSASKPGIPSNHSRQSIWGANRACSATTIGRGARQKETFMKLPLTRGRKTSGSTKDQARVSTKLAIERNPLSKSQEPFNHWTLAQRHCEALKELYTSPWARERPSILFHGLLQMLHHVLKTFVAQRQIKDKKGLGILERNSPQDLLLACLYLFLLWVLLKLSIHYICYTARVIRIVVGIVQWLIHVC